MRRILTIACAIMLSLSGYGRQMYISPQGDDSADGTCERPYATLAAAQRTVQPGDTVWIRGGTYRPTNDDVMGVRDRLYNCVYLMERSGTPDRPICYYGYPGERPVFDLSDVLPPQGRISVLYVSGDWLRFRNFEIVHTRILPYEGNWQSECVSNRGGSHNVYENLAMHDGMGIGFYLLRGSDNLVLNCDAYNNYENVTGGGGGARGGNVDGFGMHPQPGSTGNVMRGCRAWWNADDGFDLINATEAVTIDSCIAMYNGYVPGTLESAGDGNGFKAGGYGMKERTKAPESIPRHVVSNCIAYYNKVSGLYANHHLGGLLFSGNRSMLNRYNYNMLNRLSHTQAVDVDGYDHIVTDNVSYMPRQSHIANIDTDRSQLSGNTFDTPGDDLTPADWVSTDPSQLIAPRGRDGQLPPMTFLLPRATAR